MEASVNVIKLVAKVQESPLPPLLLKKNISFQDERLSLKEKLKSFRLSFIFSTKKKKIPPFKTSE